MVVKNLLFQVVIFEQECNRIANTLKNTVVTRNNDDNESNNPTQPENVRIMFDVMTQDHQ